MNHNPLSQTLIIQNNIKDFFYKTPTISKTLKVHSCKLYNNEYMTTSTKITNTEIFAFIAVLVFKLLSHKVLFIRQ